MKNLVHNLFVFLLIATTSGVLAAATVPPLEVTVASPAGKLAYKGNTSANGTFATGNLAPGNYVVQFKAKGSAGLKGNQFLLVVSAGKRKVTAEGVEGEKFVEGGVAMKVDVGPGLKITGQVAGAQQAAAQSSNAKVKVIDGKRYVWVGPEIGSNMPGRWVEEDSANAPSAYNAGGMSKSRVRGMQEKGAATLQE